MRINLPLKNTILKNITFLSFGQILSQVISLIGAFYIPRILGPEKYGSFQIIINYVMMFRLLTFTGINKINIRDIVKNKKQLRSRINNTLFMRFLFACISVLISFSLLFITDYSTLINNSIYIFSFYLVLFGIEDTINSIFYSIQRLKYVAYINVIKSLTQVCASLIVVYLGYGVFALVIIYLFAELTATSLGFYYSIKYTDFKLQLKLRIDFSLIKKGLPFSFIDFLNLLSSRIDIVMLSFLTNPVNIGIYAFANTIARKGLIVRRAISQSIYPYYSEKHKSHFNFRFLNKHLLLILLPSLIIILFIFFTADFIVIKLAGIEFKESVKILKILVFYLIFHYAVIPFSTALESQKLEKLSLYIGIIRASTNVILNYVFFQLYGIEGIAYSTLTVWVLNFIVFYGITYKKFRSEF